jgi:hypothetical protein
MAHMYWTLCCANPECGRFERVAYIGDVNPHSVFVLPIDSAEQFEATCPQCGNVHTYEAASFAPIRQDQPPEDGFGNWFPV